MTAILALFGTVGLVLVALGSRLGRSAFLVGALAPAAATVWVCVELPGIVNGAVLSETVSWVGPLDLSLDLRLDGFAATMTLIVGGIGVLVFGYAASYFSPKADHTAGRGRTAGLLVLFAGAMLGLVQADNLLALYTFWEITSITSYLLIGHDYSDPDARAAALQALLVTSAGGLAMLGGFVVLGEQTGSYLLSDLASRPLPGGAAEGTAVVLVLIGAFTKSAQYPFHSWLPGAMAAPTPVSAYLHSATMVTAGVYLIARLAPALATSMPLWRPLVLTVGIVTLVAGGLRALRQHDLKLLLAFGTVGQLGLMVVLFGAGTPAATTAGWALLVAHALFKAGLFMVVGVLDHETGTRDLRRLPPLSQRWRWVEAGAALCAASMAGVPLLAGFVAKESAYAAFAEGPFSTSGIVLAAIVGGSMLTVAYSLRFQWGAFVAPRLRTDGEPVVYLPAPSGLFSAPATLLALAGLALGVAPGVLDALASASVTAIDGSAEAVQLALWHGFTLPLALSALTLAGGALVWASDRRLQRVLGTGSGIPTGEDVYQALLRALASTARRVTGVVQNGSLPIYSGVILTTAAVLPLAVLAGTGRLPTRPAFGSIGDVPIAGVLVVAALGAAIVRERFSAALFLGAAGYAMAGLFVVYGAPDLALTQVVVETLATVVFVLVLRRLPERFERQSTPRRRALRIGIAALVGLTVFVFALVASGSRTETPVSEEIVARALPDGEGSNVVNVILVDFRGLDTLGEITVLVVASIGAVALARAGRRPRVQTVSEPLPRLVFVDVSVQVIFYAVLLASLWLLFAGHNQPGGGFVGGLLAGSAITLRYVAGGIEEVRGRSRFRPWTVLGTGLLLAAGTAAVPLLAGDAVLDVASTSRHIPLIGTAKLSSALVFDAGVYLTVVGVVLMAFEAFGDDPVEVART